MGNRQAQPGAGAHGLRREKRIEYPVDEPLGNPRPGIADFDTDTIVDSPRAQGDLATFRNGLGCIHQQIHEDLVQLRGDALDLGNVAVVLDDLGLVLEFVPHHVERALQPVFQVCPLDFAVADV